MRLVFSELTNSPTLLHQPSNKIQNFCITILTNIFYTLLLCDSPEFYILYDMHAPRFLVEAENDVSGNKYTFLLSTFFSSDVNQMLSKNESMSINTLTAISLYLNVFFCALLTYK